MRTRVGALTRDSETRPASAAAAAVGELPCMDSVSLPSCGCIMRHSKSTESVDALLAEPGDYHVMADDLEIVSTYTDLGLKMYPVRYGQRGRFIGD